jgi:1-acyl-sn-glycerol-3-phosphate acyltransferase
MIIRLRSLIFTIVFYGWAALCGFFFLPFLFLPRICMSYVAKKWCNNILWMCDHILHLHTHIIGQEKLPKTPVIFASKHQSAWETLVFPCILSDPSIVLKRELLWIPFFGWYLKKVGMIPLSRAKGKGTQDLKRLIDKAKHAVELGRSVLIFPEGTRSTPGQKTTYQSGVASLYMHLKIPVIPIALNSGLYWPRRSFLKYPGVINVEFLDPISPGLSRQAFMKELENSIESKTNKLIQEARS